MNERRCFFRSEEGGAVCQWLPSLPAPPHPPSLHADGPSSHDGARHGESLGHSPGHEHDARSPWHRPHLPKVSGVVSYRGRCIRCFTRHYLVFSIVARLHKVRSIRVAKLRNSHLKYAIKCSLTVTYKMALQSAQCTSSFFYRCIYKKKNFF